MLSKFSPKLLFFVALVLATVVGVLLQATLPSNQLGDSQDDFTADLERLSQLEPDFTTATNYFTEIAEEKTAVYAYQLLIRAKLPEKIDMHLLGHVVGDELYKQEGLEGMVYCTQDLRNACSHSIVIGALLENGMSVFDKVNEVCQQAPGGSGAYTMCFHGFGHGVLAYADYDMAKAVELCMIAGTQAYGNREAYECVGGAVMEMKDGIHDKEIWAPQKDKFVDSENPLSMCQAEYMPEGAKERCYSYITPFLFDAAGANGGMATPEIFPQSFAFCENEPDPVHRKECYAGHGKEFIVLAAGLDIQHIETLPDERLEMVISWCDLADSEQGALECKLEVVNSLYWGGENDYQVSLRYCSLWGDDLKSSCYSHLFSIFDYYHQDDISTREEFCDAVDTEFRASCRGIVL